MLKTHGLVVISNTKGMSLIEMLVVTVIMSVVSASMMTYFVNMFQNQAKIVNKNSLLELENEIKSLVSTASNCGIEVLNSGATIGVTNWADSTVYNIPKLKNLNTEFSNSVKYENLIIQGVQVSGRIEKENMTTKYIGATTGDPAVDTNINASLKIDVQSTVGSSIKTSSIIDIPILLVLNAGGTQIESCLSQALFDELTAMCSSLGGEWDYEVGQCSLPCPEGFIKSDNESKCELLAEDDSEDQKICNNTDSCNVMGRFLGTNYK